MLIMKSDGRTTFLSLSRLLVVTGLTYQVKGINKESSNENKWMCLGFSTILYQYVVFVVIILFMKTTSSFYETATEVRCRHNWGRQLN